MNKTHTHDIMPMRNQNSDNCAASSSRGLRSLGDKGEQFVAGYLEKDGFVVLAQNYQRRCGEIDLIARKGELLVFVEVKMRRHEYFHLSEVISPTKRHKIIMTANFYIAETGLRETVQRFDVALLHANDDDYDITYIPNAFTAPDY